MSRIAAFGYHDVTDVPTESGFQRNGAVPFKLSPHQFREHLGRIAAASLLPALVTEVDLAGPGRHLLLTFDDGVGSSRVDLQACKLEYSIVSPK